MVSKSGWEYCSTRTQSHTVKLPVDRTHNSKFVPIPRAPVIFQVLLAFCLLKLHTKYLKD